MSKQYQLTALNNFTCIGNDCPDNCCKRQWYIQVEQDIYNKWQLLGDSNVFKKKLINSIKIEKKHGQEMHLLQRKEGSTDCVHLGEEGLCSIQQHLGPDMMASVCRDYPRLHYKLGKVEVDSASLSCPEMTRLVIFSYDEPVYSSKGNFSCPIGTKMTNEKILWHLNKITDHIFTGKNFALNIGLTYLVRVVAEIKMLSKNSSLNDAMLKSFSYEQQTHMNDMSTAISAGEFGTQPANARYMWYLILNELAKGTALNEKLKINEIIDELLVLYKDSSDATKSGDPFSQKIQSYKHKAHTKTAPYSNAFKRYMQAALLLKGFPWTSGEYGHVDSLLRSVIPFATVQLIVWLFIEKHKEISDTEIITIINGVESRLGHNTEIIKIIEKNTKLRELELYFDWFLDIT